MGACKCGVYSGDLFRPAGLDVEIGEALHQQDGSQQVERCQHNVYP